MKQSALLGGVGALCLAMAFHYQPWGWLLIWVGADFLILAAAYLTRRNHLFGKRPDGTIPLWSWGLFLPYFTYANLVWNLARLVVREPAWNAISRQLFVGRRLVAEELPGNIVNYVDLTAEFQEPGLIRQISGYLSFPILDGGAPTPTALAEMIAELKPGNTYLHCAQGHGRSGLVALALLITTRTVASVDEGLRFLQSARPRIHLNSEQRDCIEAFARLNSQEGGSR